MEEKKWLGADLIFDLDADHVQGAETMTYRDMCWSVGASHRPSRTRWSTILLSPSR